MRRMKSADGLNEYSWKISRFAELGKVRIFGWKYLKTEGLPEKDVEK